jgi:hypothetical protein
MYEKKREDKNDGNNEKKLSSDAVGIHLILCIRQLDMKHYLHKLGSFILFDNTT